MQRFSRSLFQYYVALRLSAGAATALLPFALPQERNAIVRTSRTALVGGLDPREVIRTPNGLHDVITIPLDHASKDRGLIGLN